MSLPVIVDLLKGAGIGGEERVVGGIPNYGGALVNQGHLEFVHEGKIELGELDGSDSEHLPNVDEYAREPHQGDGF